MPRNATYFDGELRRALLDAALREVEESGASALSLRGLAKAVGVSHAAPANHFADKRALFTAIAVEGFGLLDAAFRHTVATLVDPAPRDVLRAGGRAYVRFATDHRAHYQVMFRDDLLAADHAALRQAGADTLAFLTVAVTHAQTAGFAAGRRPGDVAVLLWSALHGFSGLWLDGRLPEQLDVDLDAALDGMLDLLVVTDPSSEHT